MDWYRILWNVVRVLERCWPSPNSGEGKPARVSLCHRHELETQQNCKNNIKKASTHLPGGHSGSQKTHNRSQMLRVGFNAPSYCEHRQEAGFVHDAHGGGGSKYWRDGRFSKAGEGGFGRGSGNHLVGHGEVEEGPINEDVLGGDLHTTGALGANSSHSQRDVDATQLEKLFRADAQGNVGSWCEMERGGERHVIAQSNLQSYLSTGQTIIIQRILVQLG